MRGWGVLRVVEHGLHALAELLLGAQLLAPQCGTYKTVTARFRPWLVKYGGEYCESSSMVGSTVCMRGWGVLRVVEHGLHALAELLLGAQRFLQPPDPVQHLRPSNPKISVTSILTFI